MPFKIIRNDITRMNTDAIVNTANPRPVYSSGTDHAVYEAAGAERLLAERRKIGNMEPGQAAITPGFDLPAKYIIHTVGPIWQGGENGEEAILADCYRNCLQLAKIHRLHSISFPMISTGVYGFPKDKALQIALSAISAFLTMEDMLVYLVVFDRASVQLSEKLVADIDSFIDDHYVAEKAVEEYTRNTEQDFYGRSAQAAALSEHRRKEERSPYLLSALPDAMPEETDSCFPCDEVCESAEPRPMPAAAASKKRGAGKAAPGASVFAVAKSARSLEDILGQADETFQQQLFRLIKERGLSNKDVYSKANIDKRLFSKIKGNINYMPKKPTALALCIALELNLDQSRDLLARAGYSFSPSSKFDLVVEYFIEQEVYDMYTIEAALFAHDLPTLINYG